MKKEINISYLKNKWNVEKTAYRNHEVGSGVQSFVKDFLECDQLLNLKEGSLSTASISRKNEFIHEKKSKESRKADFYIYISEEISIPVEVECYGNIKAGESQLLNYQRDFNKKYGILTDGNTWRFYNNQYILREFLLDDILNKPLIFLSYWYEYIKPDGYYLSFFEKQGQLNLFEDLNVFLVEENRKSFFEDITQLIRSFTNKIQIEGYLEESDDKSKEQRSIELTYAYIIQFILYKTLVDNYFGNFPDNFSSLSKQIYASLKNQSYKEILGLIGSISSKISENIYRPFSDEQEFINKKMQSLFFSLQNSLNDVSPWLDIFIFIRKYNFSNVRNDIFGFIYENYLKELYEDKNRGQYFTDPDVVNFMLEQIGYTTKEITKRYQIDKDSISIIDPACGSGTFLYSATDIIVDALKDGYSEEASIRIEDAISKNVFGLDIAEFPLYLAEMSIIMRLLPIIINKKFNNRFDNKIKVFKTKDSLSEFLNTGLKNTLSDILVSYEKSQGQIELFGNELNLGYESYVRNEDDLRELKQSVESSSGIPRRRFDYVIGNPPYIGYNECSKQKLLIIKNIQSGDVKLNNIYGVNLHSLPDKQKKSPPKPNLYSFFIALGIALLKDGGKLSYVIPQTLLTAGDQDVLRYHLAKYTSLEKIFVFSGKMFIGRGLGQDKPIATSSLIFTLTKNIPNLNNSVELVYYTSPDDSIKDCLINIKKSKNTRKISIKQQELLMNCDNWNYLIHGNEFVDFYNSYKNNSKDLSLYYDHNISQSHFQSNFIFDIGYDIDEKSVLSTPPQNGNYFAYPKLNSELWRVCDNKGYWLDHRKEDDPFYISLLKANQGYRLLDSKFKIIWSYQNPKRFHFTDFPVIWARNQICSIGSDNRNELLYLFALLNSSVNQKLLSSLLKSENEKSLLISITAIKSFIRVPFLIESNIYIKDKIINLVDSLLLLETLTIEDLVDFSGILVQSYTSVFVDNDFLVLELHNKKVKLPIKKNKRLVSNVINRLKSNNWLNIINGDLDINYLKSFPAVDFDEQLKIKNQIDDLIFSLYFDVFIPPEIILDPLGIENKCRLSVLYNFIND